MIRLPELGIILTCFEDKDNGRMASMLVRIRPGWEELAQYLRTGLTEPGCVPVASLHGTHDSRTIMIAQLSGYVCRFDSC